MFRHSRQARREIVPPKGLEEPTRTLASKVSLLSRNIPCTDVPTSTLSFAASSVLFSLKGEVTPMKSMVVCLDPAIVY